MMKTHFSPTRCIPAYLCRQRSLLTMALIVVLAGLLSACVGGVQPASSWPGVTVHQDIIYLAHGNLYALNAADGSLIWQYPEKADPKISFYAAPAVTADGQVVIGNYGTDDHLLYSFDAQTGVIRWTFEGAGNNYVAGALATATGIFAPNSDGTLYALDLNGKKRWSFTTKKPLWATPATNGECDCVFLPAMDHTLYALNAETGSVLWAAKDLGGALVATPTFSPDGKLYVGTFSNKLLALNASTGSVLWTKETENWVWTTAALDGDNLYFADLNGNFYALNAQTGAQLWVAKAETGIVGQPLISGNNIYFTTNASKNESVYGFTKDGAPLPPILLSGRLMGPVLQSDDLLLASPLSGKAFLIAFTPAGEQKWVYPPVEK